MGTTLHLSVTANRSKRASEYYRDDTFIDFLLLREFPAVRNHNRGIQTDQNRCHDSFAKAAALSGVSIYMSYHEA
jgi:hypothetical protein